MRAIVGGIVFSTVALAASAQEITLTAPDADDQLTDLLETSSLVLAIDPEQDPAPQDYVAAARADYRTLLTALYSAGYYGGSVTIRLNGQEAASLSPLDAPSQINTIAIDVTPGPAFTFGTAQIAPLPEAAEIAPEFAAGETAEADLIRQAAAAGVSAWRDAGHAKAEVADQQITARHPARQLDARVTLDPGPRLTFGQLIITGNEDVRERAIRRIAGLPEGEVFSPDELDRAARRLRETGAFDSVAMQEGEIGPGNTLPITAQIAESLPRRFGAGIEFSTVEGLTLSGFWLHRNAFGGAERFRVEAEVSGLGGGTGGTDYQIATSLTYPAVYGPDTDLTGTATISREDEPDYLLDKAAVEVIATRLIFDDLTVSGGFGLLTAREETALATREYTLLTAPLEVTLDRRETPSNALNGYYINVDATPFIDVDGGETQGARLYLDARAYRTFGEGDKFGVAARAQVGSVVGAEIGETPADFLFFSGGSGTVRGQPYKSLGIPGPEETQTGGLSFAGAQLEARYSITDSIGVVGFYDVGYVGATETPGEDGDWHSGTGLGLRYNTGIGPIRLDIGTPANGDDAFEAVQVYIGIGQAF